MGAKTSAETKHALLLHSSGKSIYESCRIANIYPTTLYRALNNKKKKKMKKVLAKNVA